SGNRYSSGTVAETCIERLALHLVSDLAAETSPGVALPALAQFHAPLQASDPASRSADFRRYPRKLTACTPRRLLLHPDHLFSEPTPFLVFRLVNPSEVGRGRSIINVHKAHVPETVLWKLSFARPAAPNTRRAVSRRGNA